MGKWTRQAAGAYSRTGSDGKTELARVTRSEDGTWSCVIYPSGSRVQAREFTGKLTMADAKMYAQAMYQAYSR